LIKRWEVVMHRFAVTIAVATVFVAGVPIMGAGVGAAPMVAPGAIRGAADSLNVVERAQFVWLGHDYCWYDDGWNGPGWYWCGLTSGIGWGGGYGWHHWHGGHPSAYYHGAHANVSHANVSHARVSHARVSHANVSHANVSHANVSHANVSHGGGGGGAAHGGGGGGAAHGGGGGGHGRH
jgi:hypothetical protein